MLLASAPLPLIGPTITAPATASRRDRDRPLGERARRAGAEVVLSACLRSGAGGWRDAGTATTASGSMGSTCAFPADTASVQIGIYSMLHDGHSGRRCERPLVHTTITLRGPRLRGPARRCGSRAASIFDRRTTTRRSTSEIFMMYVPTGIRSRGPSDVAHRRRHDTRRGHRLDQKRDGQRQDRRSGVTGRASRVASSCGLRVTATCAATPAWIHVSGSRARAFRCRRRRSRSS